MTAYSGTAGAVRDILGQIGGVKTWSLDIGAAELDGSEFGSTWLLTESGVAEWSGTFEGNYDDQEDAQSRLWNAFIAGETVFLYFYMDVNALSFSGHAALVTVSSSQGNDNLGNETWSFKGMGRLTF